MSDYDQRCAHCGGGSRPGDPLWTRFGSSYHVACRTPPPAMRDLDDEVLVVEDVTAPRARFYENVAAIEARSAAIEARAYGHREPIPDASAASPAVESPPGEPGASPVTVAGVVPAAPSHDDVPLRRGDSDSATPAAARPGESSAGMSYEQFLSLTPPAGGDPRARQGGVGDSPYADCHRCGGTGLVAGERPCPCVSPSPDPASSGSVTSSLGGAGSGDSEWDRALELGDLEQLVGRLRALADAVDDPGSVVSGRTMAELIRMAVGGAG